MDAGYIVAACLAVLFIYQEYRNRKMIDSLLNRLMSRDYRDYKVSSEIAPRPRKVPRLESMTDEVLAEREAAKAKQE